MLQNCLWCAVVENDGIGERHGFVFLRKVNVSRFIFDNNCLELKKSSLNDFELLISKNFLSEAYNCFLVGQKVERFRI